MSTPKELIARSKEALLKTGGAAAVYGLICLAEQQEARLAKLEGLCKTFPLSLDEHLAEHAERRP